MVLAAKSTCSWIAVALMTEFVPKAPQTIRAFSGLYIQKLMEDHLKTVGGTGKRYLGKVDNLRKDYQLCKLMNSHQVVRCRKV